jgi:hypothetical protein
MLMLYKRDLASETYPNFDLIAYDSRRAPTLVAVVGDFRVQSQPEML